MMSEKPFEEDCRPFIKTTPSPTSYQPDKKIDFYQLFPRGFPVNNDRNPFILTCSICFSHLYELLLDSYDNLASLELSGLTWIAHNQMFASIF